MVILAALEQYISHLGVRHGEITHTVLIKLPNTDSGDTWGVENVCQCQMLLIYLLIK